MGAPEAAIASARCRAARIRAAVASPSTTGAPAAMATTSRQRSGPIFTAPADGSEAGGRPVIAARTMPQPGGRRWLWNNRAVPQPDLVLICGDEPFLVDRAAREWRRRAAGSQLDVEIFDQPAKLEPLA